MSMLISSRLQSPVDIVIVEMLKLRDPHVSHQVAYYFNTLIYFYIQDIYIYTRESRAERHFVPEAVFSGVDKSGDNTLAF